MVVLVKYILERFGLARGGTPFGAALRRGRRGFRLGTAHCGAAGLAAPRHRAPRVTRHRAEPGTPAGLS